MELSLRVKEKLLKHRNEIIELYQSGKSTSEIAKIFSVNAGSIYWFLKDKCNIKMRKRPALEDYRNDIYDLYYNKTTCYEIAKRLGLNQSTCFRYCRQLGLDFTDNCKRI
jgi:transposase